MTTKKKYLWILVIAILAVFVIGTGTVTYAWFLSLYSSEYEFQLDSRDENRVILRYYSPLAFASGNIDTATNALIPATAKTTVGIEQEALTPLDVFDVDTVSPAHTGKVREAAHAVHFTASGAYWVGYSDRVGELSFTLTAYVEEGGVPDTPYDLVADGEVAYFLIVSYMGKDLMYYDGLWYINDGEHPTLTFPDLFTRPILRYWRALTSSDTVAYRSVTDFALTTDGTQLLLAPNSEFSYDLYVFAAKTDEELDSATMNGKTLALNATLSVPALNP